MTPWFRRELVWLAVFLAFGFLVLPALVYAVGQALLGEYRPEGGMGLFYADLYRALGRLEPWAWLLLTGPYLGILALRMLWLALTRRAEPEDADENLETS